MSESFVNNYVIQIMSGHPGNTNYEIISTKDGFASLISSLQQKLDRIEQLSEINPQRKNSPTLLWSDYATLVPGRTSRIYLSFAVDNDLMDYHVGPTIAKRIVRVLGFLSILGLLIFAFIGAVSIFRGIF